MAADSDQRVSDSNSIQGNGGGGTMRMGSLGLLLKGDMGAGRVTRLRGQVLN